MESDCQIFYEKLLLLCDTDYGYPTAIAKRLAGDSPSNYAHFNNRFDKLRFYEKLCMFQHVWPKKEPKSIVVYGRHLNAFEFINFLIKHNIDGNLITLVVPYDREDISRALNWNIANRDDGIEDILRDMLDDLGVTTYERMNLYTFEYVAETNAIKSVTFRRYYGEQRYTFQCDLFVSFREQFMPYDLLHGNESLLFSSCFYFFCKSDKK